MNNRGIATGVVFLIIAGFVLFAHTATISSLDMRVDVLGSSPVRLGINERS